MAGLLFVRGRGLQRCGQGDEAAALGVAEQAVRAQFTPPLLYPAGRRQTNNGRHREARGGGSLLVVAAASATVCAAQLQRNYYAGVCPDVESIVRGAVARKYRETFITVGVTVHLGEGPPGEPVPGRRVGDGFDTILRARAAVDAVPRCRGRGRHRAGRGPSYAVELGRLDGLTSTASSVDGKLALPSFNLDQLTALFAANGLSQTDMIALSSGHMVGFAHCGTFTGRIRGPSAPDPALNRSLAARLRAWCPDGVDPRVAVSMDVVTPRYFRNLRDASDQVLYTDPRSRPTVDAWAQSSEAFGLGPRWAGSGSKTGPQGNIRRNCAVIERQEDPAYAWRLRHFGLELARQAWLAARQQRTPAAGVAAAAAAAADLVSPSLSFSHLCAEPIVKCRLWFTAACRVRLIVQRATKGHRLLTAI
ncbi:peroxidase 51-like [Panicum miliaceum]|uniref:Peroxidase 51-like n=1 Tax=Panicum miliaceum TaxID=4540 RepID=A0A3L6T5M4_PANMI|nr:peroxidase 51-like [Panicum miliaceum]